MIRRRRAATIVSMPTAMHPSTSPSTDPADRRQQRQRPRTLVAAFAVPATALVTTSGLILGLTAGAAGAAPEPAVRTAASEPVAAQQRTGAEAQRAQLT